MERLKVRNNIYPDICQKLLGKGIQSWKIRMGFNEK